MKKALRKLIPAMVMLLIAAAFVGTSTYAWFSMNRIVNVSGMSVTTEVKDSLLISAANVEANYAKSLTQTREGKLRPVSTVDGVTFFYADPSNVTGAGSANNSFIAYSEATVADPSNSLSNTNAGKTTYDSQFQTKYGVTGSITTDNVIYGYIDYSFYIKATNVAGVAADLKLTKLNLLYYDTATTSYITVTDKAWRVAVFAQDAVKDTALDTAPTSSNKKALLTLTGAHTNGYDSTAQTPAEAAANSTSSTSAVTYTSAAWAVDSIAAGATEYNKVTVRLWLEGEDTTCTNETYARLTNAYTLALEFRLGGSAPEDAAVTVIGSTAA